MAQQALQDRDVELRQCMGPAAVQQSRNVGRWRKRNSVASVLRRPAGCASNLCRNPFCIYAILPYSPLVGLRLQEQQARSEEQPETRTSRERGMGKEFGSTPNWHEIYFASATLHSPHSLHGRRTSSADLRTPSSQH